MGSIAITAIAGFAPPTTITPICDAGHHPLRCGASRRRVEQMPSVAGFAKTKGVNPMSKANDLEGRQDMGGKHGGQAGMPTPEQNRDKSDHGASNHGIVRDGQGQEQPADKSRAQHVSRKDKGDDPPGDAQP